MTSLWFRLLECESLASISQVGRLAPDRPAGPYRRYKRGPIVAVYVFGVLHGNVTAEFPHMTFSATTKPSTTQITAWIILYAAQVVARLEALGVCDQSAMSTTITTSSNEAQYYVIQNAIIQAVCSRVHPANQEQDTELAEIHREEWHSFLASLDEFHWRQLGDIGTSKTITTSWTADRAPFWTRDGGFQ